MILSNTIKSAIIMVPLPMSGSSDVNKVTIFNRGYCRNYPEYHPGERHTYFLSMLLIKFIASNMSLALIINRDPIYLIYTRTSNKAAITLKSDSIPRQIESCREFLTSINQKPFTIFSDTGVSGDVPFELRPQAKKLLGFIYILNKYFNKRVFVVSESPSRISRTKVGILSTYQLSLKLDFRILLCIHTNLFIDTGLEADMARKSVGIYVEEDKRNTLNRLDGIKKRTRARNSEIFLKNKDLRLLTLTGNIKVDGRDSALKSVPGLYELFQEYGHLTIDELTAIAHHRELKMPNSETNLSRATIARNLTLFRKGMAYINSNSKSRSNSKIKPGFGSRKYSTFTKIRFFHTSTTYFKDFVLPNLTVTPPTYLDLAQTFVKKVFNGQIHFIYEENKWFFFNMDSKIWVEINPLELESSLVKYLINYQAEINLKRLDNKQTPINYSQFAIKTVFSYVKQLYQMKNWPRDVNCIAFNNGVLSLKDKSFTPLSSKQFIRNKLPYNFIKNPLNIHISTINDWLLRLLGSTDRVELIRNYLYCCITGHTNIQKYLELIGPGGTGKSTLIEFFSVCVGNHNKIATELSYLEHNRFELGNIYDKKLIIIADSERYSGSVKTLKQITGEDLLRLEIKFQPVVTYFKASGLVIISANEPIQASDHSTGLSRRRIVLLLDSKIVDAPKVMISQVDNNIHGELANHLPHFVSHLLMHYTKDQASEFFYSLDSKVPSLTKEANIIDDNNPIVAFSDSRLIYVEDPSSVHKLYMGGRISAPNNTSVGHSRYIYANYSEFCRSHGFRIMNSQRFCYLLLDHFNHRLNSPVLKKKDNKGIYLTNLRFKD